MALSKQESTRETSNLACIAQIILDPCTSVLQDVLTKEMHPLKVHEQLKSYLKQKKKLNVYGGYTWLDFNKIKDNPIFNIPMLYASLRYICSISPHQNKWGNFPEEQDRSLSANIERIYSLFKEYREYPNNHLKVSIFEQERKNVYQTIKELEEHLGSDTTHQDTLEKLKPRLMGPNEEEHFIQRLRNVYSPLANTFLQLEEEEPDIEYSTMESELTARETEAWMEYFSESEYIDKYGRTKPITSKELRELFNSFKITIPDDPLFESFAEVIICKDVCNLVKTVNSLSNGVVLSTKTSSNKALIFEMEVVDDGDQLCVVKKDNSKFPFQQFLDDDNPTKVILITSKSLPIVKAKLTVYKKYKHVINERKIFLHHEYEEFDDVAKMVAYQKVVAFCSFVESVINSFSVDLYKIITDHVGKSLTAELIENMCLKAFYEIQDGMHFKRYESRLTEMLNRFKITGNFHLAIDETVGILRTCQGRPKRDWRKWIAIKIHQKISKKGEIKCTDARSAIWNVCQKTVDDLGIILSGLEEFHTRVLPVDHKKQIDELLKREVIEDKASFQEYQSIIKCIAGQRDDKNVVKVYLSCDTTEETKEAFKQKCKLENTDFEFVNIEETTEMPEEINQIKPLDRIDPDIDRPTVIELKRNIREHTSELYARYSNIIGIQIGKRVHCDTQWQLCIILYCLDKTLIPFGEKKLPDTFAGCPCVFREDFIMLGNCTEICKSAYRPELGCSIGIPSNKLSGSVGFMYKSRNSSGFGSGFLTASHVAIESCHELYSEDKLHELTKHSLGQKEHYIVHPSWKDSGDVNQIVGQVMQAYYGNNPLSEELEGLDFAVVKTEHCREEETETVDIYNENDGLLDIEVMKTGRTTGLRFGNLVGLLESANIEQPVGSGKKYRFDSIYAVDKIQNKDTFFELGDSGSGVFVVEEQKPVKALGIGIGIAIGTKIPKTFVCKIANILKTLELEIVRYREINKEQTLASTEEK